MDELTPLRRRILEQLAVHRGLTTAMIAGELEIERVRAWRELNKLQTQHLIIGQPYDLGSPKGGNKPYLWRLLKRGAVVTGITTFGSHYYRAPAPQKLEQRGAEMEIARQVAAANWLLLHPEPLSTRHRLDERTRQSTQLVEAVREVEKATLAQMQMAHQTGSRIMTRPELDEWNARARRVQTGEVEGFVPWRANEYLAYKASQPLCTVLLILHPVEFGREFWTRPRPSASTRAKRPPPPGRLAVYGPLARLLPGRVVAVFGDLDTARACAPPIKKAGLLVRHLVPAAITQLLADVEAAAQSLAGSPSTELQRGAGL